MFRPALISLTMCVCLTACGFPWIDIAEDVGEVFIDDVLKELKKEDIDENSRQPAVPESKQQEMSCPFMLRFSWDF